MAESIFEALFFGQPKSIANSRNNIANANNLNSNDNIQFGINWCESDYKKTKYIAEFYNTFTNIVYVYVGIKAILISRQKKLPLRFYLIAYFVLFTGITSALFHATLQLTHQRLDEIFENASMISIYHTVSSLSIYNTTTSIELYILFHVAFCIIGILFVTYFLFCEIHLIGISILSGKLLYNIVTNNEEQHQGKHKLLLYRVKRILFLTLIGGICWLLDRIACEPLKSFRFGYIQLHAWCKFCVHIYTYIYILTHIQLYL